MHIKHIIHMRHKKGDTTGEQSTYESRKKTFRSMEEFGDRKMRRFPAFQLNTFINAVLFVAFFIVPNLCSDEI